MDKFIRRISQEFITVQSWSAEGFMRRRRFLLSWNNKWEENWVVVETWEKIKIAKLQCVVPLKAAWYLLCEINEVFRIYSQNRPLHSQHFVTHFQYLLKWKLTCWPHRIIFISTAEHPCNMIMNDRATCMATEWQYQTFGFEVELELVLRSGIFLFNYRNVKV